MTNKKCTLVLSNNFKKQYKKVAKPDWLLVYQYEDEKLNLLLIATGSHSELFK